MIDPLEAVLRPIANLLNRNIRATTPARKLCRELDGTVVAIRVSKTALAASFIVHDDHLELTTEISDDPDVLISGSLLTLARIAGDSGSSTLRDGSVEMAGDVLLAEKFQQLLDYAKPDVEEELASVVGDAAAHRLGEFARGVSRWSAQARDTMSDNIREYLQEESRDLPSRYEIDRFTADVDALRDDVARLAARIERLQGD
jgi:ubiquinone biosynthesis protein UbiJ